MGIHSFPPTIFRHQRVWGYTLSRLLYSGSKECRGTLFPARINLKGAAKSVAKRPRYYVLTSAAGLATPPTSNADVLDSATPPTSKRSSHTSAWPISYACAAYFASSQLFDGVDRRCDGACRVSDGDCNSGDLPRYALAILSSPIHSLDSRIFNRSIAKDLYFCHKQLFNCRDQT